MKQHISLTVAVIIMGVLGAALYAQDKSAQEILQKVDEVANAPKDQYMKSTMVLIDRDGDRKERKTVMYQKGDEKRLVRFLSPADQKGISFLSLPNDVMYLYLPAFRKIRMIASHVKNENFAGTDFSYDDMSSFKYAEEYNAQLVDTKDEYYILELRPKPGIDKDYSKLNMTILKDTFVATKMEYYDKGGNLWKVMTRENLVERSGYWIAMIMEMKDLKKNHNTKIIIDEIELDSGLSDKLFTKRNLKKIK